GAPGNSSATNNTTMAVGLNTSVAGARTGSVQVNFQSDGTFNSGTPTSLTPQTVNVNGTVYRTANPLVNTGTVTLAARVGDTNPPAGISITTSPPDAFTEGLNVTRGAPATGFSSSGSISNLAAGATSTSAIQVSLNTGTAGTFTGGTQALSFVSTGT